MTDPGDLEDQAAVDARADAVRRASAELHRVDTGSARRSAARRRRSGRSERNTARRRGAPSSRRIRERAASIRSTYRAAGAAGAGGGKCGVADPAADARWRSRRDHDERRSDAEGEDGGAAGDARARASRRSRSGRSSDRSDSSRAAAHRPPCRSCLRTPRRAPAADRAGRTRGRTGIARAGRPASGRRCRPDARTAASPHPRCSGIRRPSSAARSTAGRRSGNASRRLRPADRSGAGTRPSSRAASAGRLARIEADHHDARSPCRRRATGRPSVLVIALRIMPAEHRAVVVHERQHDRLVAEVLAERHRLALLVPELRVERHAARSSRWSKPISRSGAGTADAACPARGGSRARCRRSSARAPRRRNHRQQQTRTRRQPDIAGSMLTSALPPPDAPAGPCSNRRLHRLGDRNPDDAGARCRSTCSRSAMRVFAVPGDSAESCRGSTCRRGSGGSRVLAGRRADDAGPHCARLAASKHTEQSTRRPRESTIARTISPPANLKMAPDVDVALFVVDRRLVDRLERGIACQSCSTMRRAPGVFSIDRAERLVNCGSWSGRIGRPRSCHDEAAEPDRRRARAAARRPSS